MRIYHYLFLSGLSFFGSCGTDREQAPVNLDGEYQVGPTTMAVGRPIRMYTKNGLVANEQEIGRFLSRNPWGAAAFNRADVPVGAGEPVLLTIKGNKQATLVYAASTRMETVKAEVTARTDRYFVLSQLDSSRFLTSSNQQNRCTQLSEAVSLVQTGKRCGAAAPSTHSPFSQACRFRWVWVIGLENGRLFVPQLSSLVQVRNSFRSCGEAQGATWNVFNPAMLNQLAEGDTLVVQERAVSLTKK